MKRLSGLAGSILLGLVSLTQPLCGAEGGAQNCSKKNCLDGVEVFGQALYWKWTGARTEFAAETGTILSPTVTRQTTHDFNPDYQWGFRAGLGWHPCDRCSFAELSYLRFDGSQRVQAFGFPVGFGALNQFIGSTFGLCTYAQTTEYQNVDLTLGRYVMRCKPLAVHVYGGGRWIYLKESATLDGPNTPGPGHLESFVKFNGGAFKLGLGADVCCFCLTAFGAIDVLTVIGTQSSDESFNDTETLFIRPERDTYRVSTGLDLKLGLKGEWCCRCFRIGAQVGYEIQSYFDVMRPSLRQTDIANDVSHADGGFGGPYVGLTIGY